MSPVLPPKKEKEESVNSGVSFPRWLHTRLGEVAAETGYSRNEVVIRFLEWALEQHDREVRNAAEREKQTADLAAKYPDDPALHRPKRR